MSTHLVIPDTHAHPDHHNERFDWLGKLVMDIKPDKIIMIGDWADMPSLCVYDEGKASFEGKRYKKDVASAIDAQDRFFSPMRKAKKKRPKMVMLEGNHEYRIKRAINLDAAKLDGVISPRDLQYEDNGWEYVEYNGSTPGVHIEDGVAYAHYFISGVMGRPIGGIHPAYQLLQKHYMSCTQGHVHTTDYCVRGMAHRAHLHGMVVGVFQDYHADFAGEGNALWWKGVVVKRNVENGTYDPQWISLDAIRKEYSQ